MIERYVCQTHAPTHNQYRMEVCEVFEVEREGEEDQFNNVGNRYVLSNVSLMYCCSLVAAITVKN